MADIVADIANASAEQATGIEQVNKALTQMDEVTQQNSALVEENAATAKTLEHQAKAMDERVAFFQIDAGTTNNPGRQQPRQAAGAAKFRHVAANGPPAGGSGRVKANDWKEFLVASPSPLSRRASLPSPTPTSGAWRSLPTSRPGSRSPTANAISSTAACRADCGRLA